MDKHSEIRGSDDARPDISALASTVISVLSDKSDAGAKSIRGSVVRRLVSATLRQGVFHPDLLLEDLRDSRVSTDQILDIYIPEAARRLGAMWVDDDIGFAAVTIASARLQGLLTRLAPPWSARGALEEDSLGTLFVLPAGSAHTLGPHVATAQLRRMGASVRLLFGPQDATILSILHQDRHGLVLFSCAHSDHLARVATTIRRIRTEIIDTPPIAVGGLVLELEDRVKERTGADLVTSDVRVAFKLCDRKRQKPRSVAR